MVVDALGTLAITKKLYKHPDIEDTEAWSISLALATLNVFAVAALDVSNALYPIYLVVAKILIVSLSLRKQQQ